jgi:hypothetical protein
MSEIKCKFVAVDAETAPNVKEALELIDFSCTMINMENASVEGAIDFADLALDDGTCKYLF